MTRSRSRSLPFLVLMAWMTACLHPAPARRSVHGEARAAEDIALEGLKVELTPLAPAAIREYLARLDAEAAIIRSDAQEPASATELLAALNRRLFGPAGFTALRFLTVPESTSLAAVLDNRRGTCVGLAIVYQALADRLGLEAHGVATPVHLFERVALPDGPRNVELLESGRQVPDEVYRRRHGIDEASVEKGVFLADLSSEEVLAHLLSNQAVELSRQGRLEEALERYAMALARAPNLVVALYNRGIDLMTAGRLDEALASFDKAIALFPDDAEAHNNRGITRARLGDAAGARADFERALELDPAMKQARENLRKLPPASAIR